MKITRDKFIKVEAEEGKYVTDGTERLGVFKIAYFPLSYNTAGLYEISEAEAKITIDLQKSRQA